MPCCFTTTRVPSDRPCSAFREQIGERHAGTRVLRRAGSKKGRGQHQPPVEEKKKKKTQKRLKALFRSLRLSPRSPVFFFCSPTFHTDAPCGTLYLPKAISNAPARAQVCSIVSRPTYRVPRSRVLPSLLCVWPL